MHLEWNRNLIGQFEKLMIYLDQKQRNLITNQWNQLLRPQSKSPAVSPPEPTFCSFSSNVVKSLAKTCATCTIILALCFPEAWPWVNHLTSRSLDFLKDKLCIMRYLSCEVVRVTWNNSFKVKNKMPDTFLSPQIILFVVVISSSIGSSHYIVLWLNCSY